MVEVDRGSMDASLDRKCFLLSNCPQPSSINVSPLSNVFAFPSP